MITFHFWRWPFFAFFSQNKDDRGKKWNILLYLLNDIENYEIHTNPYLLSDDTVWLRHLFKTSALVSYGADSL